VQEYRDCLALDQQEVKRDEATVAPSDRAQDGELIYEPEHNATVQTRGIVDTIQTLGRNMGLQKAAKCSTKNGGVHNEFVWTSDIVASAVNTCTRLREDIEKFELTKDGGVGKIYDNLTNGHNKRGHQLQDKRKLTVHYLLNLIPPAKATIDEIKAIATGVYDLCNDGIERIMSKEDGCAEDIKYFRPSKAKSYTTTAAVDGLINMYYGGYEDVVATLRVDFKNDAN
jgi:hypothetical protein